jgi:hypothetical protein
MITEWLFVSTKYIFHQNKSIRQSSKKIKRWLKKLLDDKGKEVLAEDSKVIMVIILM